MDIGGGVRKDRKVTKATMVAALGGSGGGDTYVVNGADVSKTNTVFADLLTIPLVANGVYSIDVLLNILAATGPVPLGPIAGGWKVGFGYGTLNQFDGMADMISYDGSGYTQNFFPWVGTLVSGPALILSISKIGVVRMSIGLVNGSSANNFIIKGAQGSTHATPTIFRKSSWARYKKLN